MNFLFSPQPLWPGKGLGLVRILFGLLMAYHGKEVFQPELMESYLAWEPFQGPNGRLMVYAGKSAELISGLLLCMGLFTRLGALICIAAMSYITFGMGEGRFWYEEQHPFLCALFGVLFLFAGPGAWSLDGQRGKNAGKEGRQGD